MLKGDHVPCEQFCLQVEEHSQKKLTYISDSHNAFRGILGRAEVYTYLGVPFRGSVDDHIQPERLDADFTRGLVWISR
jgi:hypothetical protein